MERIHGRLPRSLKILTGWWMSEKLPYRLNLLLFQIFGGFFLLGLGVLLLLAVAGNSTLVEQILWRLSG